MARFLAGAFLAVFFFGDFLAVVFFLTDLFFGLLAAFFLVDFFAVDLVAFFLAEAFFFGDFLVTFLAVFFLATVFFLPPPKAASQLSANCWVEPTLTTLISEELPAHSACVFDPQAHIGSEIIDLSVVRGQLSVGFLSLPTDYNGPQTTDN